MTKGSRYCDPHIADQHPAFTVLQATRLPDIPLPSSRLQNLLCQYQFDDIHANKKASRSKKNRAGTDQKRKRRMNGFIAFRSFYSKTIKGTSHQKELSSKLAAIWKDEPSHQTWNCYALQYNATGGEETFVNWLNRKLGFENAVEVDDTLRIYKNHTLKNVEDVFLETRNCDSEDVTSN